MQNDLLVSTCMAGHSWSKSSARGDFSVYRAARSGTKNHVGSRYQNLRPSLPQFSFLPPQAPFHARVSRASGVKDYPMSIKLIVC